MLVLLLEMRQMVFGLALSELYPRTANSRVKPFSIVPRTYLTIFTQSGGPRLRKSLGRDLRVR